MDIRKLFQIKECS